MLPQGTREDYAHTGQDAVADLVNRIMAELDPYEDGVVSWAEF